MSVSVDPNGRLFTIHTKCSTYQMKADSQNVLLHTYYGPRIDGTDMSYTVTYADRGFSGNPYELGVKDKRYSLDVLPQEMSCFGTGDYRVTGLRVRNADGSRAADLRYTGYTLEKGKYSLPGLPAVHAADDEAETLTVRMEDPATHLQAELLYGVLEDQDIITRAVRITNGGEAPVALEKAASLNVDWQFDSLHQITFQGRHCMERNLVRNPVDHGVRSIGSVRGTSSHHYNPFTIFCQPSATETAGECWGFSLLYSGEFQMETEMEQMGQTRFVCGIHPDNFDWPLAPGETFTTPEVMMSFSDAGLGKLSRNFHTAIREHICRGEWAKKRRPVLLNNWEATYFDFTGDKLVSIAEEAKRLGVELFVLDDGWFGKRDDDNSGLGDWFPNEKKLGCTLRELGRRITDLGLLFGTWFEPEGISEDSDLYRAHPDWAVQIPGRAPNLSRNQLILDFSRADVQDYIIQRMSAVLSDAPVSYVKWDFNRSVCDKFSGALPAHRMGEFAHRYVLGLYRVLETLNERFPHVLFEGCSGGGGRFDAGMLYYTPQIWCSDNTDAVNRLTIQYGTSFGYPVSSMGAHVSAVPNHQTGRVTPLQTRGTVAMAGTFGYELDVTKLTDAGKAEIREQIACFQRFYDLIQSGDYYRLTSCDAPCVAWEFAAEDGGEALVSAVGNRMEGNAPPSNVKIQGLQPDARYEAKICLTEQTPAPMAWFQKELETWEKRNRGLSGAALRNGGLTLPPIWREYQAWQIHLTRLPEGR